MPMMSQTSPLTSFSLTDHVRAIAADLMRASSTESSFNASDLIGHGPSGDPIGYDLGDGVVSPLPVVTGALDPHERHGTSDGARVLLEFGRCTERVLRPRHEQARLRQPGQVLD